MIPWTYLSGKDGRITAESLIKTNGPVKYVNGAYRTGPVKVSFFSRAFPSLVFKAKVMNIVIRGSSAAKRGKYDIARWEKDSIETLDSLESVGVKLEVTGAENPASFDGPCVFAANHMSTLETFVLPSLILPLKNVTFVVKKSLVEYPVFRHIMRASGPIVVSRANPREDLKTVLEEGSGVLAQGRSVIVFPQTTRSFGLDPAKFNSIGVKLAARAGVPVVPVALRTDAWGNGRLIKDFGRIDPSLPVRFAFGKPLGITGRGNEEHKAVVEFIGSKLREWGVLASAP